MRMMIAAGHEDCDDINTFKRDPALQIPVGRPPEKRQRPDEAGGFRSPRTCPTGTRSRALASARLVFIARASRDRPPASCSTLMTPMTPPTASRNWRSSIAPVSGWSTFFDSTCGKRPYGLEVARILLHVISRIRKHWPKVAILVHADCDIAAMPR